MSAIDPSNRLRPVSHDLTIFIVGLQSFFGEIHFLSLVKLSNCSGKAIGQSSDLPVMHCLILNYIRKSIILKVGLLCMIGPKA